MGGKAETIARGLCGSDPPTRRRRARSHLRGRAEENEREARISRREMQPSACLEIELLTDRARDGGGHARAQCFLERPKSLHLVFCLDQDQASRGKAELVEPMSMRMAVSRKPSRRDDEKHRLLRGNAPEERRGKTEGRRQIAFTFGEDLMQSPAGEAALRQMRIECGKAEREGAISGRRIFKLRQKPPQSVHDFGTASFRRVEQGVRWLHDATSPLFLQKQHADLASGRPTLHLQGNVEQRTDPGTNPQRP